jgi:hypothetical protein
VRVLITSLGTALIESNKNDGGNIENSIMKTSVGSQEIYR